MKLPTFIAAQSISSLWVNSRITNQIFIPLTFLKISKPKQKPDQYIRHCSPHSDISVMGQLNRTQKPHPLAQLSVEEAHRARDVVLRLNDKAIIDFRTISLEEPAKAELSKFLEAEHNGTLTSSTPLPKRVARVTYDIIGNNKIPQYYESLVDIEESAEISRELVSTAHHASLTL
jgi:Cu2+-containing amine oxidase